MILLYPFLLYNIRADTAPPEIYNRGVRISASYDSDFYLTDFPGKGLRMVRGATPNDVATIRGKDLYFGTQKICGVESGSACAAGTGWNFSKDSNGFYHIQNSGKCLKVGNKVTDIGVEAYEVVLDNCTEDCIEKFRVVSKETDDSIRNKTEQPQFCVFQPSNKAEVNNNIEYNKFVPQAIKITTQEILSPKQSATSSINECGVIGSSGNNGVLNDIESQIVPSTNNVVQSSPSIAQQEVYNPPVSECSLQSAPPVEKMPSLPQQQVVYSSDIVLPPGNNNITIKQPPSNQNSFVTVQLPQNNQVPEYKPAPVVQNVVVPQYVQPATLQPKVNEICSMIPKVKDVSNVTTNSGEKPIVQYIQNQIEEAQKNINIQPSIVFQPKTITNTESQPVVQQPVVVQPDVCVESQPEVVIQPVQPQQNVVIQPQPIQPRPEVVIQPQIVQPQENVIIKPQPIQPQPEVIIQPVQPTQPQPEVVIQPQIVQPQQNVVIKPQPIQPQPEVIIQPVQPIQPQPEVVIQPQPVQPQQNNPLQPQSFQPEVCVKPQSQQNVVIQPQKVQPQVVVQPQNEVVIQPQSNSPQPQYVYVPEQPNPIQPQYVYEYEQPQQPVYYQKQSNAGSCDSVPLVQNIPQQYVAPNNEWEYLTATATFLQPTTEPENIKQTNECEFIPKSQPNPNTYSQKNSNSKSGSNKDCDTPKANILGKTFNFEVTDGKTEIQCNNCNC